MTLHDTAQAFALSIHYNYALTATEGEDLFRLLWREMAVGINSPALQTAIETVAEAFQIEGKR
jgi:hypothetical protein